MENNFNLAFDLLIRLEGGITNDPNDNGGLTKYGISQRAFPNLDITALTLEEAKEIYKKNYWDVCRCDELPASFDIAVFDSAVNQGPTQAIKLLQRAIGVLDDGVIGKLTIDACRAAGAAELRNFMLRRLFHYSQLEDYKHYKKGWFNRILAVSEAI